MASVAHGILSQPGISKILDAFQSMPQTGTILVPGIFAGKSSYQAPLTAKNAAKVGRSMRKMTEEAIRLVEESDCSEIDEIPISDGRWKVIAEETGCVHDARIMGFFSSGGRRLFTTVKDKRLWISTGWGDPTTQDRTTWQDVLINFPSPSFFRGKKPEVLTSEYIVSFSSGQAIFGLRKFLGMESADWRAVFFELANRIYRSDQYTEEESKWIRASASRGWKEEIWAPVPEGNGWRIPKDFPNEENSWRWAIKSMEETPDLFFGHNEPIFVVDWSCLEERSHIRIEIRRPDKRKERLMPLQPSLQNLWTEAEKLIDNRHHI